MAKGETNGWKAKEHPLLGDGGWRGGGTFSRDDFLTLQDSSPSTSSCSFPPMWNYRANAIENARVNMIRGGGGGGGGALGKETRGRKKRSGETRGNIRSNFRFLTTSLYQRVLLPLKIYISSMYRERRIWRNCSKKRKIIITIDAWD